VIVYLDASALVKRYIQELGTSEVMQAFIQSEAVGTSIISRAETAAALAIANRLNALTKDDADLAIRRFREEWPDLIRIQATESVVARADQVAWEYSLRGFDAVHLASALLWHEQLGQEVTFATFDRQLWFAARSSSLVALPKDLPGLLDEWRQKTSS
jgi:predicted nucleic acid-binding protein